MERLSLGGLLREASLERHFPSEGAGLLGKSLAALSWSLKQRVGGPELAALYQGLGAGCVQKGSHWGACSE